LLAFLNGAMWRFFAFSQSENDDALEIFKLGLDHFESIHHEAELIAFKLKRFSHCGRKFFGSLACGS
jgi:hypothetical protein